MREASFRGRAVRIPHDFKVVGLYANLSAPDERIIRLSSSKPRKVNLVSFPEVVATRKRMDRIDSQSRRKSRFLGR